MMQLLHSSLKSIKSEQFFHKVRIYTLGNILNAAIPFLLMPVLTRYLSPEDYGVTSMFAVLINVYTPLMGLNLHGFVNVSYFKDDIDFPLLVSSCFHLLTCSVLVMGIITLIGTNIISSFTNFPSDWLWTVLVLCYCNINCSILQVIQQAKSFAKQYVAVQVAHTALGVVLSIVFVVFFGWDWRGRVLAQVASGLVFMVVSFSILYSWGVIRWQLEKKYVREGLNFGIPLLPHALCNFFIISFDRLCISHLSGMAEVGIFSVGYSLGMAINLIGVAFNRAFMPWLYEKLKKNNHNSYFYNKKIVQISYISMAGFLCLSIAYAFFMPWILSFFLGNRFYAASNYIFPFAMAAAFNAMYYIVANFIFYSAKTNYLAMITFGNAVAHGVITYVMIGKWGSMGAAWSSVITHASIFICTWILSNRVYPMPWHWDIK